MHNCEELRPYDSIPFDRVVIEHELFLVEKTGKTLSRLFEGKNFAWKQQLISTQQGSLYSVLWSKSRSPLQPPHLLQVTDPYLNTVSYLLFQHLKVKAYFPFQSNSKKILLFDGMRDISVWEMKEMQ